VTVRINASVLEVYLVTGYAIGNAKSSGYFNTGTACGLLPITG